MEQTNFLITFKFISRYKSDRKAGFSRIRYYFLREWTNFYIYFIPYSWYLCSACCYFYFQSIGLLIILNKY